MFGIRVWAVQGRNMGRNKLRETSTELSFSVGEIECKEGQGVWGLLPALEGQLKA